MVLVYFREEFKDEQMTDVKSLDIRNFIWRLGFALHLFVWGLIIVWTEWEPTIFRLENGDWRVHLPFVFFICNCVVYLDIDYLISGFEISLCRYCKINENDKIWDPRIRIPWFVITLSSEPDISGAQILGRNSRKHFRNFLQNKSWRNCCITHSLIPLVKG
jgi:hypothetical protein